MNKGVSHMIATINKNDLVALGFSEGTSKRIIRQGKELLIARGFGVYQNKRIGTIPATIATQRNDSFIFSFIVEGVLK